MTIAATALRLTVHRSLKLWDRMIEIVVHPTSFTLFDAADTLLLGACVTAKHTDTIRLAWDAVIDGLAQPAAGIDDGIAALDGLFEAGPEAPMPPPARTHFRAWADTLGRKYFAMNSETPPSRRRVLGQPDRFAVATEGFFERPARLKAAAPEVFDELVGFYGWDPTAAA